MKSTLKDNFSDDYGTRDANDFDMLKKNQELCRYYEGREIRKISTGCPGNENVLVLKYYSFENYFLNPLVMEKLGIIKSEEAFYEILFEKWNEYLHKIKSGKRLLEILGKDLLTIQDMKKPYGRNQGSICAGITSYDFLWKI